MRRLTAILCVLLLSGASFAAIIQSGATTDNLTVDATSKAARVTLYDSRGNAQGAKVSYSCSTMASTTAGTGIFAAIIGSASKTIRVQRILVSGTCATAAAATGVVVNYRTSLSASSSVAMTAIPKDSTSGAATATCKSYTTNGTAGTGGGPIAASAIQLPLPVSVAGSAPGYVVFDWSAPGQLEAPVLRGTAQGLELNWFSATANAPNAAITFEWTEE